jgi:HlyD family secretion protein
MTVRHRIAIAAGFAVLAITVTTTVLVVRAGRDRTRIMASGTVEAREAELGFAAPGRIERLLVDEGSRVRAGDTLAWLDAQELRAAKRAAEAQTVAARARLLELERGFRSEEIEQARAALRAADQRYVDAERERDRSERLFAEGAVSERQVETQRTAFTLAQADRDAARQRLELLESGPRREQVAAQRGLVAQAEALAAQADAALSHTAIVAPFDGVVTVRHREPGETVGAGLPVLTVLDPNDRWVRIYVREDEVGRLALGLPAEVGADAFPDRTYPGEITFIATEAEFTPRNVQTTKERVKLVYRVKVRITGDAGVDLKPGLPADVTIATGGR